MMSTLPLKRKDLTLKEKVEVLEYVNRVKCSQSEVARHFGISQAQVSKLLTKRSEVLRDWQENANSTQRRKRSGKESVIDSELLEWYKEKRACNIPLNGPLLMAKAEQIAEANGIEKFRATNGWLHRWKNRSNVRTLRKFLGEPKEVDIATGSNGSTAELPQLVESRETVSEHPQFLDSYEMNCIYTCEETVLNYRAAPNSALCFSGERATGDTQKDRLTVLCCANADGSHKLEPFVIGTHENPECLKNIKTLPVIYVSNGHACMTVTLFKDWLIYFDKQMARLKRKAKLYVANNFHTQNLEIRFNNVDIHCFPSNMSLVQSNQGLISSFKKHYHKELIKKILMSVDCYDSPLPTDELSKKISLLSAIDMVNMAWTSVTTNHIKKCFAKYKFPRGSSVGVSNLRLTPQCIIEEEKKSFLTFNNKLHIVENSAIKPEVDENERSLNVDDPLCLGSVHFIKSEIDETSLNIDSEGHDIESFTDSQEVPSPHDVRSACNVLRTFLESRPHVDLTHYCNLENQITQILGMENKEKLFC